MEHPNIIHRAALYIGGHPLLFLSGFRNGDYVICPETSASLFCSPVHGLFHLYSPKELLGLVVVESLSRSLFYVIRQGNTQLHWTKGQNSRPINTLPLSLTFIIC